MGVRPLFVEEEAPQEVHAPPRREFALPMREIAAVLGAISTILGTRVVLILALAFAFILSQNAQSAHSIASNWSLGLFLALAFCPVVGLATMRRV